MKEGSEIFLNISKVITGNICIDQKNRTQNIISQEKRTVFIKN